MSGRPSSDRLDISPPSTRGILGWIGDTVARWLESPRIFDVQQRLAVRQNAGLKRAFASSVAGRRSALDIGCGTAACAASLLSFDEVAYVGIDQDSNYLHYARQRHPNAEFIRADASAVALQGRAFDVVLLFSILHHLSDGEAERVVATVRQVLAPDGVVLSAEPLFPAVRTYRGLACIRAVVSYGLLKMDRGRYIRDRHGYLRLWNGFKVVETHAFRSSVHDFVGFVLQ